jgi:mannose-6-phosphate isomerase
MFPIPQDLGERTWGEEVLLAVVSGKFSLKRLTMIAGSMGGLQYHRLKDEVQFIVEGRMLIRFDDGSGKLVTKEVGSGDVVHFMPGQIHQEEAITDCVIIEASTPHFNDRVRVENLYGLESNGGLSSTELSEVIEL